ncbi:hypothetical protein ANCCAN_16954 [Ancylostoma caninum]|uniref:Uncharacterized protein n=1 Tax=Ancylostoma caninum TaxID=29170 RepID=A0A368FY76_ANCCA|nr:hypothetical protein ANCCAN_16954 [Ancylostoma caninum]
MELRVQLFSGPALFVFPCWASVCFGCFELFDISGCVVVDVPKFLRHVSFALSLHFFQPMRAILFNVFVGIATADEP